MKAIHLFSGGLDSTVLLFELIQDHEVECIGFHYGQTHYRELDYAKRTADKLSVKFQVIELSKVFHGSSLVGGSGSVVVTNRNAIFLNIAAAIAESRGIGRVTFGATAEDYEDFPDCRPAFIGALNESLRLAMVAVKVDAPYLHLHKTAIAKIGKQLGVPFEETMSCYSGNNCGKCDACQKREVALCGL